MGENTSVVPVESQVAVQEPMQALPMFPTASQIDEYKQFLENYDKFIASVLNDKVDFGNIPGVPKPSLFKPGAEKLEKLMFLTHEKICVEKINEPDFIKYTYRTVVYDKNGNIKATCEGTCNSKERKYLKTINPLEIENTIMKMAQKRSYVGAILEATNSSGRFTQDVEDMDIPMRTQPNKNIPIRPTPQPQENVEDKERQLDLQLEVMGHVNRIGKNSQWITDKLGKPLDQFTNEGLTKIILQLENLPSAPVEVTKNEDIPVINTEKK